MSVGIIGCGSLGRSLLTSLRKRYTNLQYTASARSEASVQFLRSKYQVKATTNNQEVATCSQIFLCVKPLHAEEVCRSIRDHLNPNAVVVSTMAAVPLDRLQDWLHHDRVVKIMPTILPDGPITIYNPLRCHFLLPTNNPVEVDNEIDLDTTTAVSGCMPGFLSYLLEEWIEAAVHVGLSREIAENLVLNNLAAFSRLDLKTKEDLIELRRQVSSKGGATERGVISLERSGIRTSLIEMLWAADNRVSELSRKFRSDE
jgi:pyrroline-5-carboxylate reductase